MAGGYALNRSRQAPAEDTPAFGGVAERFRRAGELDRAIELCREGLKKFPNQLSARVTLGWSLLDQGKYDEARAELEQVLRRAPDNLAAIRGLAELHEREENAESQFHHDEHLPATEAVAAPAPSAAAATHHPAEPVVAKPPAVAAAPVDFSPIADVPVEVPSTSSGRAAPVAAAEDFSGLTGLSDAEPEAAFASAAIDEPPQILNAQGRPAFAADAEEPVAPIAAAEIVETVPMAPPVAVAAAAPVFDATPIEIVTAGQAALAAAHIAVEPAVAAASMSVPESEPFIAIEPAIETAAAAAMPSFDAASESIDLGLALAGLDTNQPSATADADVIDLSAAMLEVGGSAADAASPSLDLDLNAPMFSGSELVVEAQPIVFDEPVIDLAAAPVDLRQEATAFEVAEPKLAVDDIVLEARASDLPSIESTLAQFEQSEPVEEVAVDLVSMDSRGLADVLATLEATPADASPVAIDFSAPVIDDTPEPEASVAVDISLADNSLKVDLPETDLMPAVAVISTADLDEPLIQLAERVEISAPDVAEVVEIAADAPAFAETPIFAETSIVAEAAAVVEAPAASETFVLDTSAAIEFAAEIPTAVEAAVVLDAPIAFEAQAVNEPPSVIEAPAVIEASTVIEVPVAVEPAVVIDTPILFDAPAVIDTPVVSDVPVAIEGPVAIDVPAVVEPAAIVETPSPASPRTLLTVPDVETARPAANLSALFNSAGVASAEATPESASTAEAESEFARSPIGFGLATPPAPSSKRAGKAKAKRNQARVDALERMLRKVAARRTQLAAESVA